MSWSELERLVEDAETDGAMRRALRHCRSRRELLLAARRLGYAITYGDLQQAWALERQASTGSGRRSSPSSSDGSVAVSSDRAHMQACRREAS